MSRIDLNLIDNDMEKELMILWSIMPEKYFDVIGKELLLHGIKETQSKFCAYDLIEFSDQVKKEVKKL
tara:strand:- start:1401 stop:1604 length:204 start_codon:yes stop_codon:yes gene_type:complete